MSSSKPNQGMWVIFGALLIQLSLGAIYAWSVFAKPLQTNGWSTADTQWPFTIGLVSFALVMVFAGRKLYVFGPRKLTIAVGMQWFPDKKGLITGVAVAGFGLGAMIWVKLAGTWGGLIANFGIGTTFMIYGGIFMVLVLIGSLWMEFPAEFVAPKPDQKGGKFDFHSDEMIHTPHYWSIFSTFAIGGNFALFPAITADTFGHKFFGQNYAYVFLAYGLGGTIGPMLGGYLGDMNNFLLAFIITGVMSLIAGGIISTVKIPLG